MKKYRGFVNIENQINSIIKPIMSKKKDNFIIIANLTKIWPEIIGKKLYQFCIPHKIHFEHKKRNAGILYIRAYNPSIAFYLEANSNQIIEKIATYYGYKIVGGIRIEQQFRNIETHKKEKHIIVADEKQQKIIDDASSKINDPELKSILQKLGETIFIKNK
jgi:hypothetical protein